MSEPSVLLKTVLGNATLDYIWYEKRDFPQKEMIFIKHFKP